MSRTDVSPHAFEALKAWDNREHGRCRACYLPRKSHPVRVWVPARPLGDRRRAEASLENLLGDAAAAASKEDDG